MKNFLNVVALAGGVGGAKLVDGLSKVLPPHCLTVIVNTGDDFEHLGLKICPDLDTVCYTLAGLANPETGWGRRDETWHALEVLSQLEGPDWFRLGDHDLGLHLERTRRIKNGQTLSQITQHFCNKMGIDETILPMSDEAVPTLVLTDEGALPFQEYFVHRHCEPRVTGFHFPGADRARPAPGVLEAIQAADLIVICPSNPWVSIGPILSTPRLRAAIAERPVVAVSPIIGGEAVKGPAAKMYMEMGIRPSALAVANHYSGLLNAYVLDRQDVEYIPDVQAMGVDVLATETLMTTRNERVRLAQELLEFFQGLE